MTKTIQMFKDGEWIEWDGSDVSQLLIDEVMSIKEMREKDPDLYKKFQNYVDNYGIITNHKKKK